MGNNRLDLPALTASERTWSSSGVHTCRVFCFEAADEVGDIVGSIMSSIQESNKTLMCKRIVMSEYGVKIEA